VFHEAGINVVTPQNCPATNVISHGKATVPNALNIKLQKTLILA